MKSICNIHEGTGSLGYKLVREYHPEALNHTIARHSEEWRGTVSINEICRHLKERGADDIRSSLLDKFAKDVEEEVDRKFGIYPFEWQTTAGAVLWVRSHDPLLGGWIALQFVREASKVLSESESAATEAIEATDKWIRGEISDEKLIEAREACGELVRKLADESYRRPRRIEIEVLAKRHSASSAAYYAAGVHESKPFKITRGDGRGACGIVHRCNKALMPFSYGDDLPPWTKGVISSYLIGTAIRSFPQSAR